MKKQCRSVLKEAFRVFAIILILPSAIFDFLSNRCVLPWTGVANHAGLNARASLRNVNMNIWDIQGTNTTKHIV